MSRAVLLRLAVRLVLLPIALLSTECGGNDVVDPADVSTGTTLDGGAVDGVSDAQVADVPREISSVDSRIPDPGTDADSVAQDGQGAAPDAGDASAVVGTADAEAGVEGGNDAASLLGTAKTLAVLAGSTITNTGATTAIVGDVGVWPGTAIAGPTVGQVNGTIHLGDAVAMQAEADLTTAYNDFARRPCQNAMTGVDLGGKTLPPGVYCFAVSAAQMVGNLTLDGRGDPNSVWIFQIGSTLAISTNLSTVMINQGNACNVYWQVGSSATINGGTRFKGNVLAQASISLLTGANVSPGRVLAQTGAVTMDTSVISNAGCP